MKYWDFHEKRGKTTNLSIKKGSRFVGSKSSRKRHDIENITISLYRVQIHLPKKLKRGLPGGGWAVDLVPIVDVCLQKSLKNVGNMWFSWKAGVCWSAIVSFPFLFKKLSKSTSRDTPERPHFNYLGRWIFTRYSEIVTFSIWGPSGRPADRARAGAFSGTLLRPFFVKPWGEFDGNPQLILTIPF